MKLYQIYFLLIISSIYSFNLRQAKQSYDSYVFALQWPNGVCSSSNCQPKVQSLEANILTIHGLWPSMINGKLLRDCTSGIQVKITDSSLLNDMNKYWPSLLTSNDNFWEHEYNKHGYCMSEENGWNGYERFFSYAISLYKNGYKHLLLNAFPEKRTITMTYEEIKRRIQKVIPNATFKMNCKNKVLNEIYFFLDKNLHPSPRSRFNNLCNTATIILK